MTKDFCVICNTTTPYNTDTHIDERKNYVEGVGQLCSVCYNQSKNENSITIPEWLIKTTPNDQELGNKIRKMYGQ
jgi:hypothetical protein